VYDPAALHAAREQVLLAICTPLVLALRGILAREVMLQPYVYDAEAIAGRSLARTALDALARLEPAEAGAIAQQWLSVAPHMTAEQSALTVLVHHQLPGAEQALARFHQRWHHEPLVLDQWFATQAALPAPAAVEIADGLLAHPDFDRTVPNRVRAVVAQLAGNNPVAFHRIDGAGYALLVREVVAIDARNPQLASRLAGAFGIWRKLDESRQALVLTALDGLLAGELSSDTRETVQRLRG